MFTLDGKPITRQAFGHRWRSTRFSALLRTPWGLTMPSRPVYASERRCEG